MTEFERGFATKCAEYGLTENQAGFLYKMGDAVADMADEIDRDATEGLDDYGKKRYQYYMHEAPGADKGLPGWIGGRWFWRNRYRTPEEYAGRYRESVEERSRAALARAMEDVKRRAAEKSKAISATAEAAKKVRDAETASVTATNPPAATAVTNAPAAVTVPPANTGGWTPRTRRVWAN